jgi:hypothetical protein
MGAEEPTLGMMCSTTGVGTDKGKGARMIHDEWSSRMMKFSIDKISPMLRHS